VSLLCRLREKPNQDASVSGKRGASLVHYQNASGILARHGQEFLWIRGLPIGGAAVQIVRSGRVQRQDRHTQRTILFGDGDCCGSFAGPGDTKDSQVSRVF
jgi:hypothetical protein